MPTPTSLLNPEIIAKFDSILDRGLCSGVGDRNGQMCIEAAVCAALDLLHGDDPSCVSAAVRSFKIALNDSNWSSPQARAKGLRDLGIAQIGSKGVVDNVEFAKRVSERTIRVLIPKLFRQVLANYPDCIAAALRCENGGSQEAAAWAAARAAWAARAAKAAAAAAWSAKAGAEAAAVAWSAKAGAEAAAVAAWSAKAAAWSAKEAEAAAAANDEYLILSANIALDILRELKSPGCEWL